MVRKKVKAMKRLAASSILEVVTAMVIILVVFSIAMMIFINVSRSSLSARRLYAESLLRNLYLRSASGDLSMETVDFEDLHVHRELLPLEGHNDIEVVVLTVFDDQKNRIASVRGIIEVRRDEK